MNYRTDLAIERKEMLDEDGKMPNLTEGIIMKKIDYGDDITVTRIEITDPIGEVKMEKPMGNYITIEAEGILEEADGIKDKVEKVVAQELKELIKFHYYLNVLVAGLGNPMVTPDALGPSTASKIKVTNHLFELFRADGDDEMSRVSCIVPGVTATTGMETAEII